VENEFPRWKRLYTRTWEKVLIDTERAKERRIQRLRRLHSGANKSDSSKILQEELGVALSSVSSSGSETRSFTPHHTLWQALRSLFVTLLTHVRLPLAVGDEICDFLGSWISAFEGPDYYTNSQSHRKTEAKDTEFQSVESAINAMKSWNNDLAWFIFQQARARNIAATKKHRSPTASIHSNPHLPATLIKYVQSEKLRFAELVF
jgi:hypothetical protein